MNAAERQAAIVEKMKRAEAFGAGRRRASDPKPFRAKPKPKPDNYRSPDYTIGRPSLYRPEYCEQVIECMGKGFDLTAFAGSIGVCRDAVYNWIAAHSDFNDAVKKARAARLYFLQDKLLNTNVGVGVTAAIFALKNASPEEWQDRFNTTTEVNVNITKVSDEQLLQIISRSAPTLTLEHQAMKPGDESVE